jgi:hypothetical protein
VNRIGWLERQMNAKRGAINPASVVPAVVPNTMPQEAFGFPGQPTRSPDVLSALSLRHVLAFFGKV